MEDVCRICCMSIIYALTFSLAYIVRLFVPLPFEVLFNEFSHKESVKTMTALGAEFQGFENISNDLMASN